MKVPFIDLAAQYKSIQQEIDVAVAEVMASGQYIKHGYVDSFEKAFAQKLNIANCIGVGNGTDALLLSLKALDIKAGDEVLTPALSWISTAEVISQLGAKPVFVDVDSDYFTIDLYKATKALSKKTKAIIAVHLYGQPCEFHALKLFCEKHDLFLIEDCAQAHFSAFAKSLTGTVGDVAAFSFYPTKNLGAMGDAGCVVSYNHTLADKVRRLANHGGLTKNEHLFEGINSRLDELQAAILSVKLKYIDQWNAARINHAEQYFSELGLVNEIQLPKKPATAKHTYHQFVIKAKQRNALQDYLANKGITTDIHYPLALPFEPAYAYLQHSDKDFPVVYQLQNEILSLPIYPELQHAQISYVCESIKEFYRTI
ncbi:DegT/DnrJ/EryC1/StrS family aminotransferase [Chryseotalea sanaruensis]|uniref:DegT/DnrJ/EryC1/StrS family aminotransferase n=1 Tax=Chryseotalea sanaruensis TaxID=2482724 RepID=A0A401UC75_9BACT|nr:DegT/DnrJ/EryC1/StrS family aminotransferase [Chryseotalea sanaruensis]GCC52475.1 DegT/DnrJ/EryC1/StrS family aminotransferase [Chryseotalea sanaruensis]